MTELGLRRAGRVELRVGAVLVAATAGAWAVTAGRMDGKDAGAGRAGSVGAFTAGYLAVWLAAGLLAYALIEGVGALTRGFLAWPGRSRYRSRW